MDFWERHDSMMFIYAENVLYIQNGVEIYEEKHRTEFQGGVLTVTTHHLFYEPQEKTNFAVLRLPLETLTRDTANICCRSASGFAHPSIIVPLVSGVRLRFFFKNGGMENSFNALRRAVQQKAWLRGSESRRTFTEGTEAKSRGFYTSTLLASSQSPSSTRQSLMITKSSVEKEDGTSDENALKSLLSVTDKAGIGGLVRLSSMSVCQLRNNLRDIDDVMKKASLLVDKIRYLKEKQNRGEKISAEDETGIESVESTLGFGKIVRDSSNFLSQNKFFTDLAKELHSWMTHEKNKHVFGSKIIISLIELFSLYNIARGSDLVAPKDVLLACRIMSKEDYSKYTLKQFTSGRLALQQKDHCLLLERLVSFLGPRLCHPSDDKKRIINDNNNNHHDATTRNNNNNNNVIKHTETNCNATTTLFPTSAAALSSISDTQLAANLQENRLVAQDLLMECESNGYLCRSTGEFGLIVFHWNIFVF